MYVILYMYIIVNVYIYMCMYIFKKYKKLIRVK